jgi:protein TonB
LTPEQLLKEAGTAFREQRFVAPPGNNALEYYLKVLEKEPHNQTSADALREMFPFATGAVEQDINAGSVDEATRVINLLAKADPSNYTLTILRSKLDAKKKQVDHDLAVQTAAPAALAAKSAAATSNAANEKNAAAAAAPTAGTAASPTPAENPAAAAAKTAEAARTAAASPPVPAPASGGETSAAAILKAVPPVYPPEAARNHQDGWVEVEFTVKADGSVANATVVNAQPTRVFNSAALGAVAKWTFKPRMENGKAVDETVRRKIEFKL